MAMATATVSAAERRPWTKSDRALGSLLRLISLPIAAFVAAYPTLWPGSCLF